LSGPLAGALAAVSLACRGSERAAPARRAGRLLAARWPARIAGVIGTPALGVSEYSERSATHCDRLSSVTFCDGRAVSYGR
ncbi:MAG: hypothetical protein L0I76_31355, partial [Pseudonocardia sp.]|nr:hypothetical protein [Pseudonocardia sp.]